MKAKSLLAASILVLAGVLPALSQPAAVTPAQELEALVTEIKAKLQRNERTATDLAPQLAAFEALAAKYRGQKTDDIARIHYMQAMLYGQVLEDTDKAIELFRQLAADFPGTETGTAAQETITQLERQARAKAAQGALVGKPAPGLNFTWSTVADLKSLADLRGKVVVLDFWATWCGPCIASFPQVRDLTAYYKDSDVVVLGVTSIQGFVANMGPRIDTKGDPQREMALMADFIKAKDITWPIVFSAEPVFNPDYGVTGIPHMAIIAPDGTVRHTGLHPAMPRADKVQKIDALLKEFGKTVPVAPSAL